MERRHDIDWLRVIAIWLLLIYHIAIIFQPWAMFFGFIRSDELMTSIWTPMSMLNVWRIPFLFYVSGMGVFFAIQNRSWQKLLMDRTQRILVPFIVGFFAITPIHIYIFQHYYDIPASYYPHAGHLWFLFNIFCYVLLLFPLFNYLKKQENGRIKQWLSKWMQNPLGPLSVCTLFVAEVLILKPPMFEMYAMTWHGFFLGLLAFFFGFLFVYAGKTFWQTMLSWKWAYLISAALFYTIRLMVFNTTAPGYLTAIESNLWIFSLFGFGYQYLNRPSRALSYLSQAAYPVYIIHMFALYAGAYLILPLSIAVEYKLIGIITFTGIVCYLIYEFVIRRVGFIGPLFGLKWKSFKNDHNPVIVADTELKPQPSKTN
tara:strand:+ start:8227 stop:9342 length:1116 start_codon:yes stop_codon:yes gene_type:complete